MHSSQHYEIDILCSKKVWTYGRFVKRHFFYMTSVMKVSKYNIYSKSFTVIFLEYCLFVISNIYLVDWCQFGLGHLEVILHGALGLEAGCQPLVLSAQGLRLLLHRLDLGHQRLEQRQCLQQESAQIFLVCIQIFLPGAGATCRPARECAPSARADESSSRRSSRSGI